MKTYLIELAKKIKFEYDFNDYDITDEKLKEITLILNETIQTYRITENTVNEFFIKLHSGRLGMFYKQPISFLSVAQKFFDSKINIVAR